jgi:hypothetical protein
VVRQYAAEGSRQALYSRFSTSLADNPEPGNAKPKTHCWNQPTGIATVNRKKRPKLKSAKRRPKSPGLASTS